jgi:hypothetical protein
MQNIVTSWYDSAFTKLVGNAIGEKEAKCLFHALENNTSLTWLDLECAPFTLTL